MSRSKVDSELVEVVGGAALAPAVGRSRKEVPVTDPDPPQPEAEALGQPVATLSTASLSEGLDLAAVMKQAVDSARALINPRRGLVAAVDGMGQPEALVSRTLPERDVPVTAAASANRASRVSATPVGMLRGMAAPLQSLPISGMSGTSARPPAVAVE